MKNKNLYNVYVSKQTLRSILGKCNKLWVKMNSQKEKQVIIMYSGGYFYVAL